MHHVKLFTFLYEVIKDQDTGTIIIQIQHITKFTSINGVHNN